MEIQISSHEHPLLYVKKKGDGKAADCNECRKPLWGPKYGCSSCRFYLHEECLQLPQQIQHFFHPCPLYLERNSSSFTCDACYEDYAAKSFTFRCEKCNFELDIRCALPPKMKSEDDSVIQHYSHGHPLTLVVHDSSSESCCEACGKVCGGPAYSCSMCNFFLHESCLEIPREIQHFFHSCPLILKHANFFVCKACKKWGSCSRLAYKCSACKFEMGLQCALMSRTIKSGVHQEMIQPEGQDRLEHFSHGHPLLLLRLNEGDEVHCKVCKDVCPDLVYGCNICNFILHKSCAELPQDIHHPFHPRHPLTMTLKSSEWCSVCGLVLKYDFSYCCDKCGFCLDLGCARLRPSIKYDGHKHLLALFPETVNVKHCQVCSYKGCKNILQCIVCRFSIHFYCHPLLPQTIKHQCHIHQLTLFRSCPEEDIADASGSFWCHACEEERDGEAPVYYCSKCRFAAHPICVASEILPLLTVKEQMLKGSPIEGQSAAKEKQVCGDDSTLAKFDRDIAEIRAKMDPLAAKKEKLQVELIRLQADLEAVNVEMEPLEEKLEVLESDRAMHVFLFTAPDKSVKYM